MSSAYDRDADIVLVPDAVPKPADAVDELITEYQLAEADERSARARKLLVAAQLVALAPRVDECRTVRIRGEHLRCKIEYPENSWDQSRLKEAWHAFPKFRDEFLTIATLRVQLRQYKKAVHEAGPADFETFKITLRDANSGMQGTPRIVIEEGQR